MEIVTFAIGAAFGFITGGAVFLIIGTNALLRRERQHRAVRRQSPTNIIDHWKTP